MVTRRQLLGAAGVGALAFPRPSWAQTIIDLGLPGGPGARQITTTFPQKGPMILQRTLGIAVDQIGHPVDNPFLELSLFG
jgi:hypothetical protein